MTIRFLIFSYYCLASCISVLCSVLFHLLPGELQVHSPSLSLSLARVSRMDSGFPFLHLFVLSNPIPCPTNLSLFSFPECSWELLRVSELFGVTTLCTVVGSCPLEGNQGNGGAHFMNFPSSVDLGLMHKVVQCLETITSYTFVQSYGCLR